MRKFLAKGLPLPTAIFAANDDSAIGCMQALKEAGIGVPNPISVVGCDNIELGQWYMPSLTTVDIGLSSQGRAAVAEVVSLIEGEHYGSITKTPGHLVERASCILNTTDCSITEKHFLHSHLEDVTVSGKSNEKEWTER